MRRCVHSSRAISPVEMQATPEEMGSCIAPDGAVLCPRWACMVHHVVPKCKPDAFPNIPPQTHSVSVRGGVRGSWCVGPDDPDTAPNVPGQHRTLTRYTPEASPNASPHGVWCALRSLVTHAITPSTRGPKAPSHLHALTTSRQARGAQGARRRHHGFTPSARRTRGPKEGIYG